MTRGMRHLHITQNFLKEKFAEDICVLKKIDSKNNNSDIGTKRLPFPIFDYLTYPLVDRSLRDEKKYDKSKIRVHYIIINDQRLRGVSRIAGHGVLDKRYRIRNTG
jgi:hypothetical protein